MKKAFYKFCKIILNVFRTLGAVILLLICWIIHKFVLIICGIISIFEGGHSANNLWRNRERIEILRHYNGGGKETIVLMSHSKAAARAIKATTPAQHNQFAQRIKKDGE